MKTFARRLRRDRSGATSLEYGLIAALVFLVALAAMQLFGDETDKMYQKIETAVIEAT